MTKTLTKVDMIENALREIAAHAAAKGGEWASDQAFTMLEFIDKHPADVGYRMHAMHESPPKAANEAREILASLFEKQFPVEAERVRKGIHFMLPASWAIEAVQSALTRG